uniref:Uncharacterized protein n=1 Tax=Arundo donax TaxID=35708 RepID=A0A0A9UFS3_ARUDO
MRKSLRCEMTLGSVLIGGWQRPEGDGGPSQEVRRSIGSLGEGWSCDGGRCGCWTGSGRKPCTLVPTTMTPMGVVIHVGGVATTNCSYHWALFG